MLRRNCKLTPFSNGCSYPAMLISLYNTWGLSLPANWYCRCLFDITCPGENLSSCDRPHVVVVKAQLGSVYPYICLWYAYWLIALLLTLILRCDVQSCFAPLWSDEPMPLLLTLVLTVVIAVTHLTTSRCNFSLPVVAVDVSWYLTIQRMYSIGVQDAKLKAVCRRWTDWPIR